MTRCWRCGEYRGLPHALPNKSGRNRCGGCGRRGNRFLYPHPLLITKVARSALSRGKPVGRYPKYLLRPSTVGEVLKDVASPEVLVELQAEREDGARDRYRLPS